MTFFYFCLSILYIICSFSAVTWNICIRFCYRILSKRQVVYLPASIYKLIVGTAVSVSIRTGYCKGQFLFLFVTQTHIYCLLDFQRSCLLAVCVSHCHSGCHSGFYLGLSGGFTVAYAQLIILVEVRSAFHYLVLSSFQVIQSVCSILCKIFVWYLLAVSIRTGHCKGQCRLLLIAQVFTVFISCKYLFQLQASRFSCIFICDLYCWCLIFYYACSSICYIVTYAQCIILVHICFALYHLVLSGKQSR